MKNLLDSKYTPLKSSFKIRRARFFKLLFLVLLTTLFLTIFITSLPRTYRISNDLTQHNINDPDLALYYKFQYNTDYIFPDTFTIHHNILQDKKFESLDQVKYYDSDPRLYWTVYLDNILQYDDLTQVPELPFSWYDFADFHDLNKLIGLSETQINCEFFFNPVFPLDSLTLVEEELSKKKDDSLLSPGLRKKYEEQFFYNKAMKSKSAHVFQVIEKHCRYFNENYNNKRPPFTAQVETLDLYDKLRPEVYKLQARSYILNKVKPPLSLTFVHKTHNSYQVFLDQDTTVDKYGHRPNIIQSGLLNSTLERNKGSGLDFNKSPADLFDKFVEKFEPLKITEISQDFKHSLENDILINLLPEDFEFNGPKKLEELLEAHEKNLLNKHQISYMESLNISLNTHYTMIPKYFQECGNILQFDGVGRHFDKVFFNGEDCKADKHIVQIKLNNMIKTWLAFTKANGLVSWLAHGTLYGYIYNGKNFHWDQDMDLQMPITHLHLLAEYFNQSLIMQDPHEGSGRYLLDINTFLTHRNHGNGKNNIDARFIDIDSGLYIDITGLSVSSDPVTNSYKDYFNTEVIKHDVHNLKYKDPNLLQNVTDFSGDEYLTFLKSLPEEYFADKDANFLQNLGRTVKDENSRNRKRASPASELTWRENYNINKILQLYNCRNGHFHNFHEISPLVNTFFHNSPALIPRLSIKLLRDEYKVPNSYRLTLYKQYTFLPEWDEWVPTESLKMARNLDSLFFVRAYDILNPLNRLEFRDVLKMLHNLCVYHQYDFVSELLNIFPQSKYHLKELEIRSIKDNDNENRLNLFTGLHKYIGKNKILKKNMFKDPFLYTHESRLLTPYLDEQDKEQVCFAATEVLVSLYEQYQEGQLDLYKFTENVEDNNNNNNNENESEDNRISMDFNNIGNKIFVIGDSTVTNTVFEMDSTFD
ncbi:uncharacterized protein SCODWIG_00491 [Saccharomycodes ludwigii]|uniref:LicD/FKTN/FKRP nucleotidyltransferase domain-containing protein n=1 Tax=Saccharomycodes ludwigii TaxID=36035 RepID=A0A376B3N5_9ASCO|nr:uncharacterized protein SCODWIG_00491 [Saccharomycodes ludwigii]